MNVDNDRAWNDPPPLPFAECPSSCSKRTMLNKRVSFPLDNPAVQTLDSGNKDFNKTATVESVPPSSILNTPPMAPCSAAQSDSNICNKPQVSEELSQSDVTDEEMLLFILSTFENLMSSFTNIPEKNIADIKRKIAVFKESWSAKLSPSVKQKMYQLAKELSAGNIEAADKLHHGLVVNNIREVTPWMVGVKHVIQNVQKHAPESTDDGKESEVQVLDACIFHPDDGLSTVSS